MSLYEQIAQAHDVVTFKAAAQAVRNEIHAGRYGDHHHALLYVLAIRGHVLMASAIGRDRYAGPLISNQVMLTLQADPRLSD